MEYRFIHHWQYEPGEPENQILEAAICLAAQEKSDDSLYKIAAFIAEHTGAAYVSIGLLSEDKVHVNTCVFLKRTEALENYSYPLQGTPCDAVFTQRFCFFPVKVAQSFPDDKELQHLEIESYLGSTLLSEDNELLGLVALMDVKPLENAAFAEHLILVLSPAMEEELTLLKEKAIARTCVQV